MQQAAHPGRDTARRTRDGGQLFGSEFFLFHFGIGCHSPSRETVQFGTLWLALLGLVNLLKAKGRGYVLFYQCLGGDRRSPFFLCTRNVLKIKNLLAPKFTRKANKHEEMPVKLAGSTI